MSEKPCNSPETCETQRAAPARRLSVSLLQHWREDFLINDRSLFSPGFQAVAVYRFGAWTLDLPSRLLRLPFSALYKMLFVLIRNIYGIEIPRETRIGRRLRIAHQGGTVLIGSATIGDDCLLRHNVTIGLKRDGGEPPKIGNRVRFGAGAVVYGDITIGDDVKIGPNVALDVDVPAGSSVLPPTPRIRTKGAVRDTSELTGMVMGVACLISQLSAAA